VEKQFAEAVLCFQLLVEGNPTDADAWYQLGVGCLEIEDLVAANQAFSRAALLRPGFHQALHNGAQASERSGQFLEAVRLIQQALEVASDIALYHSHVATLLKRLGRANEAAWHYQRAWELAPESFVYASNQLMNLICQTDQDDMQIFLKHKQVGAHMSSLVADLSREWKLKNDRINDKLRIGYVSADFFGHPVAFFIEPIITLHDRAAFDIYIYSNVEKEDGVTAQFRERRCHWRDIYGVSDQVVAEMIADDQIDILVDLGGHTKNNRMSLFARRLTPLQLTWLGYANTTGLTTIDYRITDGVADPVGMTEHLHTEELFRLPLSFICYQPPLDPPPVVSLSCEQKGYITFVAFNNLAKCNQQLIALWAQVLKQLPGATLVLKDHTLAADQDLQADIYLRFAEAGISAQRVRLVGKTPTVHQHLELLSEGDIALDSYPYTGTTTTCEALYMGVPVVTLAGSCHVKRVSASLLTAVGAAELIAYSEDEYVRIAAELAMNRERLQHYRTHLRTMMERSPLMDVAGFTRKLERAYRQMWQRYCEKAAAEEQA
jgi:predicted O-linked N-acetylglucosamine transferase (SPINDLY family)